MKIIKSNEFDSFWKKSAVQEGGDQVDAAVREIIAAVRAGGDEAVRGFALRFDRSAPEKTETPFSGITAARDNMRKTNPEIYAALELAADHITHFALRQKAQFSNFEYEMESGLFTGQRVIPVERAAVYVPAGRFPLFSTVLMGLIPAFCAGVDEVILASPPLENGMPDGNVLAAAGIAAACIEKNGMRQAGGLRAFALGGAQAIAALALGTETVPRVDVIAGPGNKYVAAAKRILSGETGIDFIAGPTDVLVIADGSFAQAADLAAADMLAQAEHDPDARARALVSCRELADEILAALERRLASLPTEKTARASLDAGGLIIIYHNREEAIRIANAIAPEHLEIQTSDADNWIPHLRNYGSLFAGALAAEALGDYSAGINHTLPTSGSARFTGGLSVRHFLKTVTTLRCAPGQGFENACRAAEIIARAEGLIAHAESAAARLPFVKISD